MSKPTVSAPTYLNAIVFTGMALAAAAVFLLSYPSSSTPVPVVVQATPQAAVQPTSTGQPALASVEHNSEKDSSFERFDRRMKPVMDTIDAWTPPAVFKKLF